MLYKVGAPISESDGHVQNNEKIRYKIIQGPAQENNARIYGWVDLEQAELKFKRIERISTFSSLIRKHFYKSAVLLLALAGVIFAALEQIHS